MWFMVFCWSRLFSADLTKLISLGLQDMNLGLNAYWYNFQLIMVILLFYWQNWSDHRFRSLTVKVSLCVLCFMFVRFTLKHHWAYSVQFTMILSVACSRCEFLVLAFALKPCSCSRPWSLVVVEQRWLCWALTEIHKIALLAYMF